MKARQEGFTLIELVIVIVILGVLAASALPRFLDLTQEARVASVKGMAGGLQSAASVARAACIISSSCIASAATATVNVEGTDVAMIYGYPSTGGILTAMDVQLGDFTVLPTATDVDFQLQANCLAKYTAATAAASASVSTTLTGCN